MAVTPASVNLNFVVQDNRGFKARVKIAAHDDDITATGVDLATFLGDVSAVGAALQLMTNAKVVSTGVSFDWFIAQEPSSETGQYQLVNQGAHLHFGDGIGGNEFLTVPAPKDTLFLTTTQDNLIVVNPSASILTGLQSAAANFNTKGDGIVFSLFFGGQLKAQRPRKRRVLQGA